MDNKANSEMITGVFRLRKNHPHMATSTIVDLQDDEVRAFTTVEVLEGVAMLHCFDSSEEAQADEDHPDLDDEDEDEDDEEEDDEQPEDGDKDSEEEEEQDDEEEDDEDEHEEQGSSDVRTYTVASGNSVTVRAAVIRLEPVGKQTVEGTYRIQVLKSVY